MLAKSRKSSIAATTKISPIADRQNIAVTREKYTKIYVNTDAVRYTFAFGHTTFTSTASDNGGAPSSMK